MFDRPFRFDLFRLNKVPGERDLFNQNPKSIETDDDIEVILKNSTNPEIFYLVDTVTKSVRWDVREFESIRDESRRVCRFVIASSVLRTIGDSVTEIGIRTTDSAIVPPVADTAIILIDMKRHLVAVEHLTLTSKSMRWKTALETILEQTAASLGYSGRIEIEPVPEKLELTRAFNSFHRITRLKLTLRLPNPELSRMAAALAEQMRSGGIREYVQDMRNPRGLSKEPGNLPRSSIEIAENGYKKGEVTIEGVKGNKREIQTLGKNAASGQIEAVRSAIRVLSDASTAKETKRVLESLEKEIARICPPPEGLETEQ